MKIFFISLIVVIGMFLISCGEKSAEEKIAIEYGLDGVVKNGTIDTRIGKLSFENGYPSRESVEKLFDAMDFQRATQAYIWALPIVSMAEWQSVH